MTNRTVVIRKQSLVWQSKTKRKNYPTKSLGAPKFGNAGFISPVFVVLACTAFSGLFYIYSVNQTATKGIAIRNAEKEVADQQKFNESLKIKEAELKSLYHIEDASKNLNLVNSSNVKYIDENQIMAYNAQRENKN